MFLVGAMHLSTCILEKLWTEKETVKDVLAKLPCFHAKHLHPCQSQEQMEIHFEMGCAMPNGNRNTVNGREIEN